MYWIGAIGIFNIFSLAASDVLSHGKIVSCIMPPEPTLKLFGNNIRYNETNWNLCTHLLIIDDYIYQQDASDYDNVGDVVISLRMKYPHLKILLTSDANDILMTYISKINPSPKSGEKFIRNIVKIVKRYYDGLDLHFDCIQSMSEIENTSNKNGTSVVLIRRLKRAFKEQNLLLTSTFTTNLDFPFKSFNISAHLEHFDLVHYSPIDRGGGGAGFKFGYIQSELAPLNVERKINDLIDSGLPASKIVLGVPFFGVHAKATLNQNINEAETKGLPFYNVICQVLTFEQNNGNFPTNPLEYRDEENNEKIVVSYPMSRIIANFMKFVVEKELAGAVAILMAADDYEGKCNPDKDTFDNFSQIAYPEVPKRVDKTFPFMWTINEALYKAMGARNNASYIALNSFWASFVLLVGFSIQFYRIL